MFLVSAARWLTYNLFPVTCPECGRLMSPVLRRTPVEVGVPLAPHDPRFYAHSDWLACEGCPYVVALDLEAEEA